MNDRSEMMAIADGSESANMHRPRTMAMSADSSYASVSQSLTPLKAMDQLAGASLTLAHLFRGAPSLLGSQIVREPIDERLRLWPLHREDPEV